MQSDRLAGFRGSRPEQLRQAYATVDSQPTIDSAYQRYALGIAAEKLMAGLATAEDVGAVMGAVVRQAEQDAMNGLRELLAHNNPASDEAQAAHFQARVASQVLTYINDLVRSGVRAAEEINEEQESRA